MLDVSDLAPLDQFHFMGALATSRLIALANIKSGSSVLDVGSGIGGPARAIALATGSRVVGLDLSTEYCEIARTLTQMVGLDRLVGFRQGDATKLPFESSSFDTVWTQHVAMNIEDRLSMYSEMFRVLRPNGKVAIYDAVKIGDPELFYPVPWAATPKDNHFITAAETRLWLEDAGFVVVEWIDLTEDGKSWMAEASGTMEREEIGIELLIGQDFANMRANYARNVVSGRLGLLMGVVRKAE
jgi:SAM-dependent methyltransferase